MKRYYLLLSLCAGLSILGMGCNESSSSSYGSNHDFGVNDPDLYVCIGDSITQGFGGVTPYPRNLALLLGKTVVNQGRGGERIFYGASRTESILDLYRPGHLLILHGVNDILDGRGASHIIPYLRSMIQTAKARNVLPAISTITPFVGNREFYNETVYAVNREIRALAAEEGILLVDGERVINGREDYVLADGLHLSEAGSLALAAAWSDRL